MQIQSNLKPPCSQVQRGRFAEKNTHYSFTAWPIYRFQMFAKTQFNALFICNESSSHNRHVEPLATCRTLVFLPVTGDRRSSFRLKLSPSPSARVTVSRLTGSSSSRSSKRKRGEPVAKDEGQLLVSENATASGAVTISPTDMDGNAVTLSNDTTQVSESLGD